MPGLRKLDRADWKCETAHFAERFQLFMIIALGETIVITGATTSDLDLDTARCAALGLAFLATAALWWLYFDYVAPDRRAASRAAPKRTGSRATRTRTCTS